MGSESVHHGAEPIAATTALPGHGRLSKAWRQLEGYERHPRRGSPRHPDMRSRQLPSMAAGKWPGAFPLGVRG